MNKFVPFGGCVLTCPAVPPDAAGLVAKERNSDLSRQATDYGILVHVMKINADKPHLWKADIAASIDQFNQWFIRFAPDAFRTTRLKTTERVKAALLAS
jgi:isoleucyl-tRNA synthetase